MGRIALLEDSQDLAELVKAILEEEHLVQWFSLGQTFLDSFRANSFDLVLLDVAMPGLSGYEVYARIRDLDSRVPVIVISAHSRPQDVEDVRKLGISDYIGKPIL